MIRSANTWRARDRDILRSLRRVIEADGRTLRLDIDVDVENGEVELLGVLPDEREHEALLALIEAAAGPRRVVDHLIVAGSTLASMT